MWHMSDPVCRVVSSRFIYAKTGEEWLLHRTPSLWDSYDSYGYNILVSIYGQRIQNPWPGVKLNWTQLRSRVPMPWPYIHLSKYDI